MGVWMGVLGSGAWQDGHLQDQGSAHPGHNPSPPGWPLLWGQKQGRGRALLTVGPQPQVKVRLVVVARAWCTEVAWYTEVA